ncbi:ATP-dependent helicase RRM3-like protein [Aphelenchoides avenae]|nr:ATP-dependent helicase RRM3-like protein [Aphelenchus avenae]
MGPNTGEAIIWQFPRQLRELFALILVHCLPKEPGLLWEKYQDSMSEDYVRDLGPDEGTRQAYEEVVLLLESMGMSLADFPDMPELPGNRWSNDVIDIDAHKAEAERLYALLNADQRQIVDEVLRDLGVVNFLRKKCYYIDGPAGVGKSFTYRTIFHCVRALGRRCIMTASTGIAATILPCGRTWHSLWKLPVPLISSSESSVKRSRELEEASVIILDEAPMLSRFGLEAAERKVRELKKSLEPFGGVIFILGGDHRQCAPIQTGAVKSEILDLCISSSDLWKHFKVRTLTQNMRLDADQQSFNAWQLSVGNGDNIHGDEGDIVIPEECQFDGDLASEVYGELFTGSIPQRDMAGYLRDRCILCVLNDRCKTYNDDITKRMSGELSVFTSINRMSPYATDAFSQDVTTETMDAYDPPELPPHELKLKVGSIIILLRNLDVKRSLCNGTRLLVTRLGTRLIEAVHVMDVLQMKKVWIPRIALESNGDRLPFKFMRTQFPVKAAFALTINKSQGQTFQRVGLDLATPVFSHGQAYVGLSRVRNAQSLRVLVPEEEAVTNIVYKEVSYKERD